jgi:hypothetical protein
MGWIIRDTEDVDGETAFAGKDGWCDQEEASQSAFLRLDDARRWCAERNYSLPRYRIEPSPCALHDSGAREVSITLSDSGAREVSITGGLREPSTDRGAYELLPPGPMHRLAVHYERGSRKYAKRNWEKGIETGRIMQSLLRHAFAYLAGGRGEDHLAAIAWNAFALMHHEDAIKAGALPAALDTLPCIVPEKS